MIALRYDNETGIGDLAGYAEGALAKDEGLKSAVLVSLFFDAPALPGDVPAGAPRRGWWADVYADTPGDVIGSRLWLLDGAKTTDENLRRAEAYAVEALQWLVVDGISSKVTASAERLAPSPDQNRIRLTIRIERPETLADPWIYVWDITLDGEI